MPRARFPHTIRRPSQRVALSLATLVGLCSLSVSLVRSEAIGTSAFDRLIENSFSQAGIPLDRCSWILVEGRSRRAQRWPDLNSPVPMGSLLKPFAALAYAQMADLNDPVVDCTGERCWLPSGHGQVRISDAIANSCNAYFEELAARTPPSAVRVAAGQLGLPAPPPEAPPNAYWGLAADWRLHPVAIITAYQELARRQRGPIIEGLRMAARRGTAAGVGQGLAKTGTAPCIHVGSGRGSNGDGYAIVLYPAEVPRYTILLRLHGRTGREAANAAGIAFKALLSP